MSFIATADFQASWSNLYLCEKAWNELLEICEERHIKTIAYLGDGKETYNPVDMRVVRWWDRSIHRAIKRKIMVLYLLGNHDRDGQHSDTQNWLPILQRAGAVTHDEPTIVDMGDSTGRMFMLPFSNVKEARKRAEWFVREGKPDKEKDVLFFHHDLKGCSYNRWEAKSNGELSVVDLHCSAYLYCIGGHVHLPQRFRNEDSRENVYYVGSPFCTTWAEVNQRKRYLVVGKDGIRSVHSKIGRWFDPGVGGFRETKPSNWNESRIRISVPCNDGENYGRVLEHARREAERRYRGATIFVVPKFKDRQEELGVSIRSSDSDKRKIEEYVRQTGFKDEAVAVKYMLHKMEGVSQGLRTTSKVKFISAMGRNFLSFKKLELDFREKGITVIQGLNEDRGDKSNGSGKTSLTQLIPVALFGKTFKEQKSDSWSNRWVKDTAIASLTMKQGDKEIRIKRGRRPPMLRMIVNGKKETSGMKSNDKYMQERIEKITGFTWQTLANAVYIDRAVADAFLSGTKKQRTDVLSRFQNLERFEKALALVKEDVKGNKEKLEKSERNIHYARAAIKECKKSWMRLREMQRLQLKGALKERDKAEHAMKSWSRHNEVNRLEKKAAEVAIAYDECIEKIKHVERSYTIVKSDLAKLQEEYSDWRSSKTGECPICFQVVTKKQIKKRSKALLKQIKAMKRHLESVIGRRSSLLHKEVKLDGEHILLNKKIGKLSEEYDYLKMSFHTVDKQYRELFQEQHAANQLIRKAERKYNELRETKRRHKGSYEKYRNRFKLYNFASEAFSRDGIPAFLNRQLCPVLNKAADYYSDLFSDKEIQVRFEIEAGEFVPQVINAKGGEEIDDQSTGERALAGLIASFALREVAPQCNLLVLDEPGEGLDTQTAKQFAKSLYMLVQRFKSIWIATHNQAILSQLDAERTFVVRKKNRISRLVQ